MGQVRDFGGWTFLIFFERIKKQDHSPTAINDAYYVLKIIDNGDKLLDVGCGNGSLVFKMGDRFKEIHGIDISDFRVKEADQISKLKHCNLVKYCFSVSNVNEGIKYQDNMFDTIICVATLEHVFDPYQLISEIYRVLRPGGVFIVEVPNIAYIKYRIGLLFGKIPATSSVGNWEEAGWDGGHLHYFNKSRLSGLLEYSGFNLLKITGAGLFGRVRNFYPSLLTGDLCIKCIKPGKQ